MRRLARWLLDSGPVLVLAVIAGAGSFTHIRDTAHDNGQTGPMSWAIAVCVDLTCVMAARERQRDKKTGRVRRGPVSWPTLVLTGGIMLSLAANLHQAAPTAWGWITAATPAAAFLIAVSMLERRANTPHPDPSSATTAEAPCADVPASAPAINEPPAALPGPSPAPTRHGDDLPEPSPALIDYARRLAADHHAKHGHPIPRDTLRTRMGVSPQLASALLDHIHPTTQPA
jgi:hypothetical protein